MTELEYKNLREGDVIHWGHGNFYKITAKSDDMWFMCDFIMLTVGKNYTGKTEWSKYDCTRAEVHVKSVRNTKLARKMYPEGEDLGDFFEG